MLQRVAGEASDLEDVALLGAWQCGDRSAGDAFVVRYFAAVYRFLRRRVVESATAEDLAQRTFLVCFERADRFGPTTGTRVYLLGIARNLLLHHFRDERVPSSDEQEVVQSLTPSRVVARDQQRRSVRDALARLPDSLRITLELHYWDELGVDEIAELLATPAGTIKWRLHRGRELLREARELGVG
jgi:RNA polymerase sigma factor (sigma-70 family)